MHNFFKKSAQKKGLPPGSLIHIGNNQGQTEIQTTIFKYNAERLKEEEVTELAKLELFKDEEVSWINIIGVHQADFINLINQRFKLHPLILEDIMNTEQRIKVEDYDNSLFVVLKMLTYNAGDDQITVEQISLVIKDNYVLSFQEFAGDVFDNIRERLRNNQGIIRKMKADYLMYCLIDAIVDNYFVILDELSEDIIELEEELLAEPSKEILEDIHKLKSQVLYLRRVILPLREVINSLADENPDIISGTTGLYLRDIYDHTIRILDKIDYFREMLNNLLDIYLSFASNKMNEVMKILTIIATIFMPLTLVAGIYGMNFKYMPELEIPWAYPAVLSLMGIITVIMLIYFKKNKML